MSMMIHRGKKRRLEREASASKSYEGGPVLSENSEDNAEYYDNQQKKEYTKTDINKMPASELQSLAAESGIDNAFEKSGGELKKLLIEKFGL